MRLRFTKMHGLGNDFVMLDGISQKIVMTPERAQQISDRRFGIGCDQLLLVEPPRTPNADFQYRIFNQDGSEVENCGNGARCFAIFVRLRNLTQKKRICVDTASGQLILHVLDDGTVTVDMGAPILNPKAIPFNQSEQRHTYTIEARNVYHMVGAVSMGNPHCVLFVNDIKTAPVESVGPAIEAHELFPNKVNVGFAQVLNRSEINLRVYERGAGETMACGTGACAAVVAGIIQNKLNSHVKVVLPGGALSISWEGEGSPVLMTGPAEVVFHGQVKLWAIITR